MISNKDRDEIINIVIDKLDSSDIEFPYREISQRYGVNQATVVSEISKELSGKDILRETGNTFHSGRLFTCAGIIESSLMTPGGLSLDL